mmetsp:Transcript_72879/g.176179  ORF Transcript_72879/g.176179 Transcript_72879/m.176179 type:complete len:560 (-) Transcript_72879:547-2226(-)
MRHGARGAVALRDEVHGHRMRRGVQRQVRVGLRQLDVDVRGSVDHERELRVVPELAVRVVLVGQTRGRGTLPPRRARVVPPQLRVVVLADVERPEGQAEIVERHPEAAVVLERPAELRLEALRPQRRVVTPVALPLAVVARRIAQLQQPQPVDVPHVVDDIRGTEHQAGVHQLAVRGRRQHRASTKQEAVQLVRHELVPQAHLGRATAGLSQEDLVGHGTREVLQRVVHIAALEIGVGTVVFGEGLLDQRDPQLIEVVGVCESRARATRRLVLVVEHREEVIKPDGLPLCVLVDAHTVDTRLRRVSGYEQPSHQLVDAAIAHTARGSNDGDGRQQPAVRQLALVHVVWVGSVAEQSGVDVDTGRDAPALHHVRALHGADHVECGRELWVVELVVAAVHALLAVIVLLVDLGQELLLVQRALRLVVHVARLLAARNAPRLELDHALLVHLVLARATLGQERVGGVRLLLVMDEALLVLLVHLQCKALLQLPETLALLGREGLHPGGHQVHIDRGVRLRAENVLGRVNGVCHQLEAVLAQEFLEQDGLRAQLGLRSDQQQH